VSQPIRLGEILIEQGVLNEQQVFEIIEAQRKQHLPFGVLAERMFDVTLQSIERAWAQQYHRFTGTLDLDQELIDPNAVAEISRRPAWQFEILPISFEPRGELLIAATQRRLPRAVSYAAARIPRPVFFRITDSTQLLEYLQTHLPMPEVPEQMLDRAREAETRWTPHHAAAG
jgi:hypothetical protein